MNVMLAPANGNGRISAKNICASLRSAPCSFAVRYVMVWPFALLGVTAELPKSTAMAVRRRTGQLSGSRRLAGHGGRGITAGGVGHRPVRPVGRPLQAIPEYRRGL